MTHTCLLLAGPDSENQLSDLFMVCFDEFHFMNDPDRGTVWEEAVISCPPSVRILALSATMGNVQQIRGWMAAIHGPTSLVHTDFRPVPLRYLYATKKGGSALTLVSTHRLTCRMHSGMLPLFHHVDAGPGGKEGVQFADKPGSEANKEGAAEVSRKLHLSSTINKEISKVVVR